MEDESAIAAALAIEKTSKDNPYREGDPRREQWIAEFEACCPGNIARRAGPKRP